MKLKMLLVVALACFSGCASKPTMVEKPEQNSTATPAISVEQNEGQEPSSEPAQKPIVARELADDIAESVAVTYLLDQAQQALDYATLDDADRASALAKRALQVDRKSPRAYLILAQSYLAQKKIQLARATAKQGLLYVAKNSSIGRQLDKLAQSR